LALDPLATLFLQVALSVETKAHALARLVSHIDATDVQLEESLLFVLDQLLSLGFLSTTPSSNAYREEVGRVPSFSVEAMNPSHQPHVSRHSLVDWEFFLTGQMVNSPLPRFSLFRRGYAFWETGNILLLVGYSHLIASLLESLRRHKRAELLRRREWETLSQRLSRLKCHHSNLEPDLLWRLARRELVFCQMLVRFLAPTGVCLVRSIAFCTYLRALGLPAQVVIGRACFDLSSHYFFHAWTELAGLVVNDHAELQSGCVVLQRFPKEANVRQSANADRLSLNQMIICCIGGLILLVLFLRAHVAKKQPKTEVQNAPPSIRASEDTPAFGVPLVTASSANNQVVPHQNSPCMDPL
jgi:hypothetical protein